MLSPIMLKKGEEREIVAELDWGRPGVTRDFSIVVHSPVQPVSLTHSKLG
jgi:hypothetical protein